MTGSLVIDPSQWQAALERAVELVRSGELDSAEAQVDVMNQWTYPIAPDAESAADAFQTAASVAGADGEVTAFEWLWKKAFNDGYFWGSCATSGVEGAARGMSVREAEVSHERERRQLAVRVQLAVSESDR